MEADLKRQVGHQVALARDARGLTQEQLAEMVGRSVEALSKIERGRTFPSPETLVRLADSLDVPIRDFFPRDSNANEARDTIEARLLTVAKRLDLGLLEIEVEHLEALQHWRRS